LHPLFTAAPRLCVVQHAASTFVVLRCAVCEFAKVASKQFSQFSQPLSNLALWIKALAARYVKIRHRFSAK
jgi:hypothetical protein